MRFKELYDFISECKLKIKDYSCLMLDLKFLDEQLVELQEQICPCEIYDEPGYGLEDEFHITVKYGLHCQKLHSITTKINLKPVKFKFTNISVFKNENYDVLKLGIISKDLEELNSEISAKIANTDSYPKYIPHATIAYIKKGTGKYYTKLESDLIGKEFISDRFIFSNKFNDKVYISVI